jgi:hypothetical protein
MPSSNKSTRFSRKSTRRSRRPHRLAIDRLESRIALAIDTLSIGGETIGSFTDNSGDLVLVSITGSAGTAVFRDSGGGIVDNGDDIASIAITGASTDFQLTVGAALISPGDAIGPKNGFEVVYLGRVTADSVIRGINTVGSDGFIPVGGPSVAASDTTRFSLESFVGVDFSEGGGLFVDLVTGGDGNVGIQLTKGFSPYSTIAIREQLDAFVILGAENKGTADGRLLIESATAASLILVNNAGSTGANSKIEILGGEGPFDAGVAFRGPFAGTVNLQSAAGGTWLFEGDVASSAVLKAASWVGQTEGDLPPGIVARRSFAGTLNATSGATSLTVGGAVKGTARINSVGNMNLLAGSVESGAEVNAEDRATLSISRNFAGRVSASDVTVIVGGNVVNATMTSDSSITLDVAGSITNSTLSVEYGISGTVGGNITNSTLTSGTDEVDLDVAGNIVNSRFIGVDGSVSLAVGGSVSRSQFTAARDVALAVTRTMTSSLVDAGWNVSIDVDGTVSKSQIVYGEYGGFFAEPDLVLLVGGDLLDSDVIGREARGDGEGTIVNVVRDARRVRFASRESGGDRRYTIGRNFQGSIQGADADVYLDVGGSVQKGSSLVTGGNAEVDVDGNFDGTVDVDALQFRVDGNVAKASRIVASGVREWQTDFNSLTPRPNFFVGGRLDGIVNVGVFDASPGDMTATILGGGTGTSARFYVGRFVSGDTIVFEGDFRGNVRVLQDLQADLTFTGNLDRITIGRQVIADITVGGTLTYLNANSWFEPTGSGKKTGNFADGFLATTGTLTTGKYVTVVPVGVLR